MYDTLAALRTTHARRLRAGSAVQRTCGKCNRSARSLWRRKLDLEENGIDEDGIAILRACWLGDSGLEINDQFYDDE